MQRNKMNGSLLCLVNHLQAGGAQRVMVNVVNYLAREGHSVTLTSLAPGGTLQSSVDPTVKVDSLECSRAAKAVFPLAKMIRKGKYDSIFFMKDYLVPLVLSAIYLSGKRPRVVYREVTSHSARKEYLRKKSWVVSFFRPFWMRRLPTIICSTQRMADDISGTYEIPIERINVIPNPVDLKHISSQSKKGTNHPWLGEERHASPVIVGMGRLVDSKGFEILVAAAGKLPGAKLILIGEGPNRQGLVDMANSLGIGGRFDLIGEVENPYAYIAKASVFVLSSRFEGFPNGLVEAMACKVPVVATNCETGPAELIESYESGILVPVDDVEKLGFSIQKILDSPELARRFVEQSANRVKNFDKKQVLPSFEKVIFGSYGNL